MMVKLTGCGVFTQGKIWVPSKLEQRIDDSETMTCNYHSEMSQNDMIRERIKQNGGGKSNNNEAADSAIGCGRDCPAKCE
jgi:hypothetical protein